VLHNLLLKRRSLSNQFELAPYNPGAAIIFMHVPKTSGMALVKGLTEALAPTRTLLGYDGVMFGRFRNFESITEELRRQIYLAPAALPPDAHLVAAHMAVSTTMEAYRGAQYVTVLREPHSRLLSHWVYWRTQSDESLAAWGKWAHFVQQARRPLSEFLACRDVACQVDNVVVRMLLWPHPLIPDGDFIASHNDAKLLNDAFTRLKRFAYADLVENPELRANVENWLGRGFIYQRVNETMSVPPQFKSSLHEELTPQALELLDARGRLDLKLWLALARERVPHRTAESLRERTLIGNVARYAWLMLA
jgi:hypothetical protein